MHLRCGIRVSTGSSMVMMWPERVLLISSTIEAIVVDLPWQVSPMISTRPEVRWANSCSARAQAQAGQRQRLFREAPDHAAEPLLALEGEAVGADARRVQVDRAVEGAVLDPLVPVRLDHFEEFFQLFLGDRRIGHRHQALGLAQQQRAVLVDDDVGEHQARVEQVQDLLDQGAEHRMVFIFHIRQGADLRRLVVFHVAVSDAIVEKNAR